MTPDTLNGSQVMRIGAILAPHTRNVAIAPAAQKLEAFKQSARHAAGLVQIGELPKAEVVDYLVGLADVTAGIARERREVERLVAEAFKTAILPDSASNTELDARAAEIDSRPKWMNHVVGADRLRSMTFAPVSYVLPGLIPVGLTILAAKPKIGKFWLMLETALATALGRYVLGNLRPDKGSVLYLALEDSKRRLQRRVDKLLSPFGENWPSECQLAVQWRRLDDGGLTDLDEWCQHHPLIVVDTLEKVRAPDKGKERPYALDYAALNGLHRLGQDRNVAIVVITHLRKMGGDDPFDLVSGTLGLTGCADTTLILRREAGTITLSARGRDIEETEHALQFDKATCRWTILGAAAEVRRSSERKRVIAALQEAGAPLAVKEIMVAAELSNRGAIDVLLLCMVRDGEVRRTDRGRYGLPDQDPSKIGKKESGSGQTTDSQSQNGTQPDLTDLTPH